jgi:hypothetical protein
LSASGGESGNRFGAVALVTLLILSLVLGILVLRARTPDLALEVTSFPKELDDRGLTEFVFFVRFDERDAKVEIVGRDQVVTRTLAPAIALRSEDLIRCRWDGIDDDGEKAAPGRYRLRVTLPGQDRAMGFPKRLDIQPGTNSGPGLLLSDPCVPEAAG